MVVAAGLLLAVAGTQAQKLEIIPKAGINLAYQSIKGVNGEKGRAGFQGGVGFNIPMGTGVFSLQPELNFIQKGTTIRTQGAQPGYNLNYLELPVLAKFRAGMVYFNAGPSLGLLLGQSDHSKQALGSLKKLDFGVQMGGGVAIPAGTGRLIIDARYTLGLSNISDVKGGNIRNRGIMLSAGYAVPL